MVKVKSQIQELLRKNSLFIVLSFLVVIGYFFSRLTNLTTIPVFADEAIYIRWSQVMRAESTLRFLPLSDGKQPFFMWLTIPFLKIIKDPLVAGRMVSVSSGLGTLIGVFVLSYLLFKKLNLSLFTSILYLICPFIFFFDRMALVDGLLSFFGVWSLVFGILLVRLIHLDLAMISGIILGLGLITKSPAIFFSLLLPTTIIFLNFSKKGREFRLGKLIIYYGVVYLFAFSIYNLLRLGPEFHLISLRNKDYVYSLSEIMKHPFNPLLGNFRQAISWFWIWTTPLIFITGILGIVVSLRKHFRPALFLFLWLTVPLIAQSLVAKVFTARYILFTVPFFLIFSAYFIEFIFNSLKNKVVTIGILVLIFLLPVYQELLLVLAPALAWLPKGERNGYLEMWTAGYGIKEAAVFIKGVAQKEKVLVGTEGYFGTLPNGLQIYLEKIPNITIIGVGYPLKSIPDQLKNGLVDNRVFLLVNDSRFEIKDSPQLKLIARYPKAENPQTHFQEHLLFFELLK